MGMSDAPEQIVMCLDQLELYSDDPFKVAFCNALHLYLAQKQFPLPHLIGTRKENNSMLQWRNGV